MRLPPASWASASVSAKQFGILVQITLKVPICSRIGPEKVPILLESLFFLYCNIIQHKVPMAKFWKAGTVHLTGGFCVLRKLNIRRGARGWMTPQGATLVMLYCPVTKGAIVRVSVHLDVIAKGPRKSSAGNMQLPKGERNSPTFCLFCFLSCCTHTSGGCSALTTM